MMKIWTTGTLTVKSIQQQKNYHNLVVNQNIPRMTFLSLHHITMFDNKVLAARQTDRLGRAGINLLLHIITEPLMIHSKHSTGRTRDSGHLIQHYEANDNIYMMQVHIQAVHNCFISL
jgi:hypothetical protein